jgi:hypothetical protein
MIYLGDFPASHTAVCIPFDSFAGSTGASSATSNFAASDVLIYKDGGTTQRASSSGITVSTSFDSQTGLQMIVVDLSDNTDAGFYAAGHEYQVAVADITIDSQTVRFWAGAFSIERAGGMLATIKSSAFRQEVADALLNRDMSAVSDTNTRSPLNALRALRNKWSYSGTTRTVCKEDDSTTAWTSVSTTSPSADAITGDDPT